MVAHVQSLYYTHNASWISTVRLLTWFDPRTRPRLSTASRILRKSWKYVRAVMFLGKCTFFLLAHRAVDHVHDELLSVYYFCFSMHPRRRLSCLISRILISDVSLALLCLSPHFSHNFTFGTPYPPSQLKITLLHLGIRSSGPVTLPLPDPIAIVFASSLPTQTSITISAGFGFVHMHSRGPSLAKNHQGAYHTHPCRKRYCIRVTPRPSAHLGVVA